MATNTWEGADQDGNPFSIGGSGAPIRFTMNQDWAVSTTASPVPAGNSSVYRHVRMKVTGSFTNVSDFKFWRSDSNTFKSGVRLHCGGLTDGAGVAFTPPDSTPTADAHIP